MLQCKRTTKKKNSLHMLTVHHFSARNYRCIMYLLCIFKHYKICLHYISAIQFSMFCTAILFWLNDYHYNDRFKIHLFEVTLCSSGKYNQQFFLFSLVSFIRLINIVKYPLIVYSNFMFSSPS